jgi:hypothetical protein
MASLSHRAESLENRVRELETAMISRDAEISLSQNRVRELETAMISRDAELHAMKTSMSWRLTYPLRRIGEMIRGLSRAKRESDGVDL